MLLAIRIRSRRSSTPCSDEDHETKGEDLDRKRATGGATAAVSSSDETRSVASQ